MSTQVRYSAARWFGSIVAYVAAGLAIDALVPDTVWGRTVETALMAAVFYPIIAWAFIRLPLKVYVPAMAVAVALSGAQYAYTARHPLPTFVDTALFWVLASLGVAGLAYAMWHLLIERRPDGRSAPRAR